MEKKSKVVDMNNAKEDEKLSYEQLEQVAGNLNRQCQQLHAQLRSAQNVIAEFNELNMLLEILGKGEHFTEQFVTRCASKIEDMVTRALDASEKREESNSEEQ